MKHLPYKLVIVIYLTLSSVVFAQQSTIQPETQGDVAYISGGVGNDERSALEATRGDYNLNLLFTARGSGEYLSNVHVQIADTKGNVQLDTVAQGPYLYVNLKPGRYIVSAEMDEQVTRKKVTVSGRKTSSLTFTW